MRLSQEIKTELFNALLKEDKPFGYDFGDEGIMTFLMEIWNLKTLPSEDNRFKDAYGDIYQHTINNYDWVHTDIFLPRFPI